MNTKDETEKSCKNCYYFYKNEINYCEDCRYYGVENYFKPARNPKNNLLLQGLEKVHHYRM